MTPREFAEKIYYGLGTDVTIPGQERNIKKIESLLRAYDDEVIERCAKKVYELGEEKYPTKVFVGGAGQHSRHLLQNVLPDEIRQLKSGGEKQ